MKLCADCAKQIVRNAQNCGKTNHLFSTIVTHRYRTSLLVRVFVEKNKTVNSFLKLKTPMKGKRFVTIEEIKEKSKQELLAIPSSEFQTYFEDWKKRFHKCIIFEGGYF